MRTSFFLYILVLAGIILVLSFDFTEIRRHKMVDEQIINRGVSDPYVIRAMREVPRHLFIPKVSRRYAYEDRTLPIGFNKTMPQPYIIAFTTAAAELNGFERVLEVGTGSGYQTAILAAITSEVYTVEIIKGLVWRAKARFDELGYENIVVKQGNRYKGFKQYAPYDVIIVTAAPEKIPKELVEQLKVGGRMVIPIAPSRSFTQSYYLITKNQDSITKKFLLEIPFVPEVKEEQEQSVTGLN